MEEITWQDLQKQTQANTKNLSTAARDCLTKTVKDAEGILASLGITNFRFCPKGDSLTQEVDETRLNLFTESDVVVDTKVG